MFVPWSNVNICFVVPYLLCGPIAVPWLVKVSAYPIRRFSLRRLQIILHQTVFGGGAVAVTVTVEGIVPHVTSPS